MQRVSQSLLACHILKAPSTATVIDDPEQDEARQEDVARSHLGRSQDMDEGSVPALEIFDDELVIFPIDPRRAFH